MKTTSYMKAAVGLFYLLLISTALQFLTSCFSDDSEESALMADIQIAALEEQYTVTSYAEQYLDIQPTVSTSLPEQNLTYRWSVMLSDEMSEENVPSIEVISTDKNLHYEVALKPQTYTLKFEVTDSQTGYTRFQTTQLVAVTEFSKGFYILKETADGNTDIDLYNLDTGGLGSNLISSIHGAPLQGTPLNLCTSYLNYYIDEADQQMKYTNQLFVSTKTGDFRLFKGDDLSVLFDRQNIRYSGLDDDEIPYAAQHSMWMSHLLTNKGVYSNYSGAMGGGYGMECSGRYGLPTLGSGGSTVFFYYYMNAYYWDETNCQIYQCDYNGQVSQCTDVEGLPIDLSAYRCIGGGPSTISASNYFVLENKSTGVRYLATIPGFSRIVTLKPVAAGTHMAKSDNIAINTLQAAYFYLIDGGKLYVYDIVQGDEREVKLQGITGDVTYVSNLFCNAVFSATWDYLLIGQQNAGDYTLHFYNMVGGIPDGTPFASISGTGKLANCRHLNPQLTGNDFMYQSTIVYPWN